MSQGFTRRRFLGTAAGSAVAGGAFAGGYAVGNSGDDGPPAAARRVPFHGTYQAGIATPAQDRLHFAAFDVTADRLADLRELVRSWSEAAARMTAGLPAGPPAASALAPPVDTGEALGLPASNLTVTVGFGPTLFEQGGEDRFGLAASRPAVLKRLPRLPGDELQSERSGGDICVQACSDDPQVAFHAVRNLARIGRGMTVMRWSQLGFGRTSTTSRSQATPRNLMGFKDGTNNIRAEDTARMHDHVWVGPSDSPAWMRGGTYMVTRRIRMLIEVWDRASLQDQEQTIGRVKDSGAPLGGVHEDDTVKLAKLPDDAHIRLAAPRHQRRRADPAPRLLLHRRHGRGPRPARRRPLLHLLPARPRAPVRRDPAAPRHERRAERVHQAHGQRGVRGAAGRAAGRLRRRGAARAGVGAGMLVECVARDLLP
jgi:deferrochelatase/peroxidase EfeB